MDILRQMGQGQFSLEELRGLEREDGLKLLDRAAEVGMLTALGGGYYRIHPALPWFFRGLFQKHYKGREEEAVRAFVYTLGAMGNYYHDQYQTGHPEIVSVLADEEANLLYIRQLAMKRGWWDGVVLAMQGLVQLYDQTGRWMEWRCLVNEIAPFFVDSKTEGPILGREVGWDRVTEYRVKLAIKSRQWDEARRLQRKSVELHREKAGLALAADPYKIDEDGRIEVRNYIVSMGDLAEIQIKMGDAGCVQTYKEAIEKSETYGFGSDVAAYSMNLGNAYWTMAQIRNLDQAEYWFRRGLELTDEPDMLVRGRCLGSLGNVAMERFYDTGNAGRPEGKHLDVAREFYQQSLKILPPIAANDIATVHNALGVVYAHAEMFDEAMRHIQQAIRYADKLGDLYWAASYRRNAALSLENAGRLSDALEYARSAQEKFEACGPTGDKKVQQTQNLIAKLEEALRSK